MASSTPTPEPGPHRRALHYDLRDPADPQLAIGAAVAALRQGELVVIPTDTVYGIAADAFNPAAVARLLEAKGRARDTPPPVLIGSPGTMAALGRAIPAWVDALIDTWWPGPLTLIVWQQGSLQWDLGDTGGTVAVRVPADEQVCELLNQTGPLAVSSANVTGEPAATTAALADDMLGDRVSIIVDGGPSAGGVASTIVDCTGTAPRLLRAGPISKEQINRALAEFELEVEDHTSRA